MRVSGSGGRHAESTFNEDWKRAYSAEFVREEDFYDAMSLVVSGYAPGEKVRNSAGLSTALGYSPAPPDMHKSGKSILIVEDDYGIREVLNIFLQSEGYRTTLADHGQQALDLLVQSRDQQLPSVILLDLTMPIMSGWKFLEVLQADHPELFKRIPVIVMSAMGDRSIMKHGAREFLQKPIDLDQLVKVIGAHS